MFKLTAIFVLSALACLTAAAPLEKRIAQNTIDSKTAWEAACNKAGGGAQCNTIAVTAASKLLAAAGPCEQQDSGDAMIDLAKTLNNDPEMIRLAQLFVQQPRNAPDSLQVPYCQVAPKNAELNGLFHCQFAGSKFPNFSGDQTGNIPLGLNAPVNPPGACPAKPDGPVPDGVQLNTLVQDPGASGAVGTGNAGAGAGAGSGTGAAAGNTGATGAANGGATGSANGGATGSANGGATGGAAKGGATGAANNGANGGAAGNAKPTATSGAAGGNFKKQNGVDAQAQNQKFASLTANSPCTDGDNACVGDSFAQCVGGKFALTPCAGGTICAALPLVNSPGTSVTCTTAADRDARIATALSS